jgi:hypothetical protein
MAPVDSLMTVQANATSLINRLTETLTTTYQDQAVWMSRLPSQPSTSGNLSVAQKHLNGIVTGFDETYRERFANRRLVTGGWTGEGCDSSQVTNLPLVGQPIG